MIPTSEFRTLPYLFSNNFQITMRLFKIRIDSQCTGKMMVSSIDLSAFLQHKTDIVVGAGMPGVQGQRLVKMVGCGIRPRWPR